MAKLRGFTKLTNVDEALRKLVSHAKVSVLEPETVTLNEALGRVLAVDIIAPRDLPNFDRSAVDGYAVFASDTFGASEFNPKKIRLVTGDQIKPGTAVRVWTGSAMPAGADAVVMLEFVRPHEDSIEVLKPVVPGQNVSPKGEDIPQGEIALKKGQRLRPQDLGLIAALGFVQVKVVRKPKIAVLSTGDELVELGSIPKKGQVIDTNRLILQAMIKELGGAPQDLGIVKDELNEITERIAAGLATTDMVITTGGTSVGKLDLVPDAINKLGNPGMLVHGIAMRPGRPTGLAVVDGKPILTFPGNPVAAMFSFEVFARPLILKMLGIAAEPRPTVNAKLTRRIASTLGTKVFLRVWVFEKNGMLFAEPIRTTGSGILTTMTKANGYVVIPETREFLEADEMVTVHLLNPVGGG
ncbi:molybdopterin molybdotransferase MoeA [Candidatus Bathyarchaeota archaeon]|nr:molybdopterin molybdotransferase MoeA [Candidatus Bathyarchaeota archaeon]